VPKRLEERIRLIRHAVNVRALLGAREFIKVTVFVLPKPAKLQVLRQMEHLRHSRMIDRRGRRIADLAVPLPEMTDGEIIREINWRLETLPPGDAETLERYLRGTTQWRSEQRQKVIRRRQGRAATPRPPLAR
jgi:hypothetical protein